MPWLTAARGRRRAALGDIGNLVGPFNKRCNVGKENGAKKDLGPAQVDRAVQVRGVLACLPVLTTPVRHRTPQRQWNIKSCVSYVRSRPRSRSPKAWIWQAFLRADMLCVVSSPRLGES